VAIVASVAGYVGLPKALVYGPSKAALINLAESLYGDLHPLGLGVYLVNPGFVDTPLTRKNEFRMPALIGADEAARATLDGIAAGRFEIHYPARFTRWVKLARLLPYRLQFWLVRKATGS
jgi:short-subunit dehydrogenase